MNYIPVLGIPVRTVSGQHLGRVIDVVVDPATQGIVQYEVRTTRLLGVGKTHLIAQDQVVSLSEEVMVVLDAATPDAIPQLAVSN
jgi:sporulation protein YlmC with PRC-barrel domain